jgi:hypothetical protein
MTGFNAVVFAFISVATANIIFPFIQPNCDYIYNPGVCLAGQLCLANNTCVSKLLFGDLVSRDSTPRADGRCGQDFDGATCDPNGPYGGCCSRYGYCGDTAQHCLVANGCQSGCKPNPTTTSAQSSARQSEPVIGSGTSSGAAASATGAITEDGTCGAGNGGTVCGDWELGSCCSM